MKTIKDRLADALYQAALEGDESPKMLISQRVVEIMLSETASAVRDVDGLDDEALKTRLQARSVNQSELARRLGVQASTVNRMVAGDRSIKLREIPIILAYLDEVERAVAPDGYQVDDDQRIEVFVPGHTPDPPDLSAGDVASKIRALLTARGLSARDASLKAGLGPDGVRTILNGHKPSAEKLKALAGVLEVAMEELL